MIKQMEDGNLKQEGNVVVDGPTNKPCELIDDEERVESRQEPGRVRRELHQHLEAPT